MEYSGKKEIHGHKKSYYSAMDKFESEEHPVKENKIFILNFIRDCRLGKTLKNRQKKSIGEARCLKYLHILKKISICFNKPFDKVKQNDMEKFIENLENDKFIYELKARNGKIIKTKKLSHSTKVDYKKTIRKFYKWLFGKNTHFPDLVDWIDTYDIEKEIPALSRAEVERMANSSNLRDKTIITVMFDSGARVEELLNIRIADLTLVEDTFKVRIVYSKTKPRTIHLPIASKYLQSWLNASSQQSQGDFLFPISYEALRRMLHRKGKRILNKKVYPHLFRHSSATYYANLINHQQLCYRYGWTMASKMPNRYLDREGIFEEESIKTVKSHDISNLEKQNRNLKEELSLLKCSNEDLHKQMAVITSNLDNVFQGKDFLKVLAALAKKSFKEADYLKMIKKNN